MMLLKGEEGYLGCLRKRLQAGRLVPRPAQTSFGVYWLGSFMIESPRP